LSDHLTAADVERFLQGTFPQEEMKKTLRHLLKAACPTCEERLRPLLTLLLHPPALAEEEAPATAGREYEAPISRALAAAMSRRPRLWGKERARAARATELLRGDLRRALALSDEEAQEFLGVPFVEALIELSFEERYRDPQEMLRLAFYAKAAAANMVELGYDPAHAADYQARASAELANAYRVNDDLKKAGEAFAMVKERLAQGTGNLLVLARAGDLQASLYADQREFSDALEQLDLVAQVYRKMGDDHLAGRALVKQGIYTNYEGDPEKALGILHEGLALLDPERDPQLMTWATESILEVMVQCGEFREAAELLMGSDLRQAMAGEPLNLIKLRWLEGQIFAGLKKKDRAETALAEARAGFLAHQQEYNAALVGLDLAEVWLRRGKKAEVRELAAEMLDTFHRLEIRREGRKAVQYLLWACDRDRLTPRVVGHVRRFLGRLEHAPYLRFEAL